MLNLTVQCSLRKRSCHSRDNGIFSNSMLKNGLDVSSTYVTDKKCAKMIGIMADGMSSALGLSLLSCHYFIVTIDGAKDRSAFENEYYDRVGMKALKHSYADGVLADVVDSFDDIGCNTETLLIKLVAFAADCQSWQWWRGCYQTKRMSMTSQTRSCDEEESM